MRIPLVVLAVVLVVAAGLLAWTRLWAQQGPAFGVTATRAQCGTTIDTSNLAAIHSHCRLVATVHTSGGSSSGGVRLTIHGDVLGRSQPITLACTAPVPTLSAGSSADVGCQVEAPPGDILIQSSSTLTAQPVQ